MTPRRSALCFVFVGLIGCRQTQARASAPPEASRVVTFLEACDASGAVAIDAHRLAVADDENNVLRVYDADKGGAPLWTIDLGAELSLKTPAPPKKKARRGPK